jgi:hypothetical protein
MENKITAEQIVNASSEDLKKLVTDFRGQPKSNENTGCKYCKDCTGCKYMLCNVQLTESQYFAAVGKLLVQ